MTDQPQKPGRARRLLPVVAGGLAVVLGAAVVFGLLREPALGPSSPPERIAAAFDKEMAQAPALAPWREALQRDFPAVYDQMRQTFVGHIQAGESKAEATEAALLTAGAYRRLHQKAVLQASDATLAALAARNREAMDLFRSSTDEVCARYVMAGNVPEGSPGQMLAVARSGALVLKAIHEGETAPTAREPLSLAEAASFNTALQAKGLSPDLARRVFEGGLDQISPADQCRVGKAIVDALPTVPAPIAAKVTAALTAHMS